MTAYSEDDLRKLNKDDLIGIALSHQSKMESSNAKVLEELKLLNDKFDKLSRRCYCKKCELAVVVSSS